MRNNQAGAARACRAETEPKDAPGLAGPLEGAAQALARPFRWMVGTVAGWGVGLKVRLMLLVFFIVPAIAALVMLETDPRGLRLVLAAGLLLAIVGFAPLSNFATYLLIGRDLREIAEFCRRLKEGDYAGSFELPLESEDDHQVVRLKRDLNWMAHVISHRESWLQSALAGAHQDKSHFETLSHYDALTGLANRRLFEKQLGEAVRQAGFTRRPLAIMFIDCDKFKSVNDCLGHQAGDLLLKNLGGIIRRNVRKHLDLPFRYGGDEFGVLCPGLTPDEALKPAERIRSQFLENRLGQATLSIGVAGSRGQSRRLPDPAELLRAADTAAYQAKAAGGNRVVLAQEDQ